MGNYTMAWRPDHRKDRPFVVLYQGRIVLTAITEAYAKQMVTLLNKG